MEKRDSKRAFKLFFMLIPFSPISRLSNEIVYFLLAQEAVKLTNVRCQHNPISIELFNAAQPGVGRVQVLGSKQVQKAFSKLASVFRPESYYGF